MVHVKDEGSQFDAPVETVWAYLQSPEQPGRAHPHSRNTEMKPLTETSFLLTGEQEMGGHWVKTTTRISVFPPLAMSVELLDGPMAGTKRMHIYTPHGPRTAVDVYGEVASTEIPAGQLEPMARQFLEQMFNEDAPAIRAFAAKK